jgi:Asp-tRNA(Asn)/Glu-tRNA(Gln) amidotransferase A subunit family amidase
MLNAISRGEKIGLEGYRALLQRARLRAAFEALAARADGFVTLGAPGAAPQGIQWTGNPAFNVPASVLGAPALTLPLFSDGGLPVGLQVIGPQHSDEKMFALSGWMLG